MSETVRALSAAKLLRKLGFRLIAPSASFFVDESTGPIREVEIERARRWGEQLGQILAGSAEGRLRRISDRELTVSPSVRR